MATPIQSLLLTVVNQHARLREPEQTPRIAVDECLNHSEIANLVNELVKTGAVAFAFPAWYHRRIRSDGTHILAGASQTPRFLPTDYDVGSRVEKISWADDKVVEYVICTFAGTDRVVVLSENTWLNEGGLRLILREDVGPTLNQHNLRRLCLLALFRKGKRKMPEYVAAVRTTLADCSFEPGFHEILL
jgi:hypothetical protein